MWSGHAVVCVASGPSLTEEDCAAVRASGHPTIVTNTTFRRCSSATVLIGFDAAWWREYGGPKRPSDGGPSVQDIFKGERLTCSQLKTLGAESLHGKPWFRPFANSGASAISLAIARGSKRIILLGFDCQRTGGQTHWHGDHPKQLSNCRSMANWPELFGRLAKYAKQNKAEVINCSRSTALKCFDRGELEHCL